MVRKGNSFLTLTHLGLLVRRASRSASVRVAGAVSLAVALALLGGGCATTHEFTVLEEPAEVAKFVKASDQPVLLMFSKQGCPTCLILEPTMDTLATEYKGRAAVGKYTIYTFYFARTSSELIDKYDIGLVPTVILLVNGQEKNRWTAAYNIDTYRKALDQYVAPPAPAVGGPAGTSPSKPKQ